MATKPSYQYQYQARPLLLRATLLVILAAAAEAQGGCRHKCGHIDIPFPFGIGVSPGCFRDGFEVLCDDAYNPPRAFLPGEKIKRVANYSTALDMYQNSWSLVELKSISVATGEVQAHVPRLVPVQHRFQRELLLGAADDGFLLLGVRRVCDA